LGNKKSARSTQVSIRLAVDANNLLYRVFFIESIRQLDPAQIEQVLTKENADFIKGIAPVLKVIEIITIREHLLNEVNELCEKEPRKVEHLEQLLGKLRSASIRAVELIVLWRDQFRYYALMSASKRLARKKKAQQAI
jgi:hypothetical protein